MLANPVLKREFLTSLRTRRAQALALVFWGVMAGLVVLMWPTSGVYSLSAQASHQLFTLLSTVFLGMVALCAPSFTAVSITAEKERQTYDLLYDSLLTPSEIVVGKLVSGVGFVFLLAFASLPMLAACLILGGVGAADLLMVYVVVLAAGAFFGLLGLYCSSVFRTSYRSLIACYAAILAVCGATWLPSVVAGSRLGNVHGWHLIRGLSPFSAMMAVARPDVFSAEHPGGAPAWGLWADGPWPFVLFAAAGGLALLALTLRQVARPPVAKARRAGGVIESRGELVRRKVSWPFYLFDPQKRRRPIGRLVNVVAAKEMRSKLFSQADWLIRAFYGCFAVSLCLAFLPLFRSAADHYTAAGTGDTVVFTCIAIPLGLVVLAAPVLTASAITEERERNVFDMLRHSPLSPVTLALGKMQVAWLFCLLLLCAAVPAFFVLAYLKMPVSDQTAVGEGINLIRPFNFQFAEGFAKLRSVESNVFGAMGRSFLVVLMSMLLSTTLGVCVSAWNRRSALATAVAYALVAFYALGTLVPHFVGENLPAGFVTGILTFNPFVAVAKAADTGAFPMQPPDLWIAHLKVVGVLTVALFLAAWLRVRHLMRPTR